MFIDSYILKVKRAETPFYARLKRIGKMVLTFQLPIPRALDPIYTFIRYVKFMNYEVEERISVACYRYPVLRSMFVSVGERLRMEQIPGIVGPVKIYIGVDVYLSGRSMIIGGRVLPDVPHRACSSSTACGRRLT